MLVIAFWLLIATLLFGFGILTLANNGVSAEYTSHSSGSTPWGDPDISTHTFYFSMNTFAASVLWGGAVAISLAIVNGIIAFRRVNMDA